MYTYVLPIMEYQDRTTKSKIKSNHSDDYNFP